MASKNHDNMTNGEILPPSVIEHMKLFSDMNPDWLNVPRRSFRMIMVISKKNPLHGKRLLLERLPNGLFKLVNEVRETQKDGPKKIVVDLEKSLQKSLYKFFRKG
ncbi:MAG: hypothetical protein EBY16_02980 [Gammaproteobacteria bacterium]|nr:hypothetical protein [Gammaproteobacteria bacterium]